jgi:hypothetical protein
MQSGVGFRGENVYQIRLILSVHFERDVASSENSRGFLESREMNLTLVRTLSYDNEENSFACSNGIIFIKCRQTFQTRERRSQR